MNPLKFYVHLETIKTASVFSPSVGSKCTVDFDGLPETSEPVKNSNSMKFTHCARTLYLVRNDLKFNS